LELGRRYFSFFFKEEGDFLAIRRFNKLGVGKEMFFLFFIGRKEGNFLDIRRRFIFFKKKDLFYE
jgi:hypothetical protein